MPPRRSARLAAGSEQDPGVLAPLPHALVLLIFGLLAVDARARCSAVCRGWRAVLRDRSLWTRLDLSAASGVAVRATDAVLRGAAARAAGGLHTLILTGCGDITADALLAVARANAGALRELHASATTVLDFRAVEALARAAPQLLACHADVRCDAYGAHQLLRNLGAFASARVHDLEIWQLAELDDAGVLALAADFQQHASLSDLRLFGVQLGTPAALQAVLDAAITCGIPSLGLASARLSPASVPALAQLLGGGTLSCLSILNEGRQLLDQPAAVLLAQAVRASTLTTFVLHDVQLWRDPAAASTLVGALVAHASLMQIRLSSNVVAAADQTTAGAALGALVAADAFTLRMLTLSGCALGDAGLGPLVDALPGNTHLWKLDCGNNDLTEAFVRDRLLPAVRANTSLRTLQTGLEWESAREAEAIVAARE
jgi:hypothetical protein